MNICMVVYEYPSSADDAVVSGEVKNPYTLIQELKRRGHDLTVVNVPNMTRSIQVTGWRDSAAQDVLDVREPGARAVANYAMRIKAVERAVARYLRDRRFDVFHAHAPALAAGVAGAMNRGAVDSRIPIVTTAHGTNLPEADADGTWNLHQKMRRLNARLVLPLDRKGFARSEKVISVSAYQLEEMRKTYRVDESKLRHIYNGVDRSRYVSVHEGTRKGRDSGYKLLFVGRLVPKKGLQQLLRALRLLLDEKREVELDVVGGSGAFGGYRSQLMGLSEELNLGDNVRWHLDVPESKLPDFYRRASVLVTPSENYESLPTVVLEAMASGLPVITTKSWGTPEALGGEHPGLLSSNHPEEIARRVVAFSSDPSLGDRAVAIQGQAMPRFDVVNTATLYEEVYLDTVRV